MSGFVVYSLAREIYHPPERFAQHNMAELDRFPNTQNWYAPVSPL
jgi:hypothetical protein